MLRAHSLLWHYLWVGPNILLLILGFLMCRRGLYRQIPAFFAFATLGAISESSVYAADMIPRIDGWTFWRIEWGSVLVVGLLKFVLIAEIFAHLFGPHAPVVKLGQGLIRSLGVVLVLAGTALAAFAPPDGRFRLISEAHFTELAVYLIESGLLLFIFLFAAYFRLRWPRQQFGIALGLSISSCVHLATLALTNSGVTESKRMVLVFFNMTTYHAVVLMWFYYLLVPQKVIAKPVVPLPDHNLEVWNRELERLIHK